MIGAVDIGGTKIAVGVVDEGGQVLARQDSPTGAGKGLADGLSRITNMLHQVSDQRASRAGEVLQGIGIGCTGPVNPQLGTIGNVEFLPGWEGADLVGDLGRAFGVSVAIENDADAAALGEWAWGAGRDTAVFILVTIGTGIGAGVVLDGRIYRGVDGSHPEIGHHVIDPSGPACFCGAHGCWEVMASGPSMERWAQANHPQGIFFTARELCAAAEQGEPQAMRAVKRTSHYLAIGLANLVTLFSPEVIALGGGLMQSFPLFRDEIMETIRTNCGLVPYQKVRVVPAALGVDSGLVGAARVWYSRYGSAGGGIKARLTL
ncbi:MAG: ROK family protein [Omnitrophica WOR_2 bacterium]